MPEQMNNSSSESQRQAAGGISTGFLRQLLGNPWFLSCAVMLCIFAIGFQVLADRIGIQVKKLPVPLRNGRSLKDLDVQKLKPYELLQPVTIQPEVLDALGTDEYIQW